MPHFPPALLRDIADQTSIVELVGRYVQLKRKGSEWWGCCPFHQEKSASFKVNEVRKAFKCFGCGEGGDAYSFLMRLEGMSFVEAVKELADRAGVTIPEEDLSPREQEELAHKDALYHANELACRYFQEVLQSEAGEAGRAELDRRGVTAEIREQYRLGVSPDAWDGLAVALKQAGISAQVAEEAGLVLPRRSGDGYYDRFRNRLMFPIRARNGKVVAFGGRTLGDDDAKYLNSSESPVYRKSSALYGLHQARSAIHKDDLVLVVEDALPLQMVAKARLKKLGCRVDVVSNGREAIESVEENDFQLVL